MTIASLFSFTLDLARILGVAAFLYLLPGLGLTHWLARTHPLSWIEHLTLAPAISLALYPILYLWAYALGIRPGPVLAWALPLFGALLTLWFSQARWQNVNTSALHPKQWLHRGNGPAILFPLLALLLFATRFSPVRFLTEPFWGDSLHHTFITQLIVENGGLFQSWQPYALISSLTYHFGFHTAAAQWVWLTGTPTPEAVLIFGQICNSLAVLALYPLALRISSGNRWAGIGALLVAGFLLTMPAYYVNWGRYTQLIGQILLPAIVWLFVVVWYEKRRPSPVLWLVAVTLAAGLVLTHYRVAVLAGAAALGWALWAVWSLRRLRSEAAQRLLWLTSVGAVAGGLILPWVAIVRGSALEDTFTSLAQRSANHPALLRDMALWLTDVPRYYPTLFWVGALLLLLFALWRKPALSVPLLLWAVFTFLATNPFLLRLPGTGGVSNFLVIIALYIPFALLWGWAAGAGAAWLWGLRFGPWLVGMLLVGLLGWGTLQQVRVIDFFYRMVWPSDRIAFQWIDENTPEESRFLVNGFSVFSGTMVVGSDGGWWLTFFTKRASTIPPALYNTEQLSEPGLKLRVANLERDVRTGNGDPALLHPVLCQDGITHIYLGERRGTVGFGSTELLPEGWLAGNPAFALLFQNGAAQVWSFDRGVCERG